MDEKKYCPVTGKVCYSERTANEIVSWLKRNRNISNKRKVIPTRVYYCKFCGTYHMTHYRQKRNKR